MARAHVALNFGANANNNIAERHATLDRLLSEFGVKTPELLSIKEKEALLVPQHAADSEKYLEIGEYARANVQKINEFLQRRSEGLHTTLPEKFIKSGFNPAKFSEADNTKVIDIINIESMKEGSAISKEDIIKIFVYGINGCEEKEMQNKYRTMLQNQFRKMPIGIPLKAWRKVKNDLRFELAVRFRDLDINKESSIDNVMDVFRQGIAKLPDEDRKELQLIHDRLELMLGEGGSRKKIVAYTVRGKDNIIGIESKRTMACVFIDNPVGSHAMFEYALDPAVVLINYAIEKSDAPKHVNFEELVVSGIAICVLGTIIAESKHGKVLFVNSLEGGINFRRDMNGRGNQILNTIILKAREFGVDYVAINANPPGRNAKIFTKSIALDPIFAKISMLNSRPQYLDVSKDISQQNSGIIIPVKLIDIKKDIRDALRKAQ